MDLQGSPPWAQSRAEKAECGSLCVCVGGEVGGGRERGWRISSPDLALSPVLFEPPIGNTSSDLETVFHKERGLLGAFQ